MYNLGDTIAAVSSPGCCQRVIVRISGPETAGICREIFRPAIDAERGGITNGAVRISDKLEIAGKIYLFPSPNSYTGDTVAEVHINTNAAVIEALMERLLALGVRLAEPGEFTARGYFNSRMDLSQAEAVGEIIAGGNKFQLAAAEKLLAGRLSAAGAEIAEALLQCLSLLEAGIDFSGEDIEFISADEAMARLEKIKDEIKRLLDGSIMCERLMDLPAAGIAGAPGAGKSSLLNAMLGKPRSIVSPGHKTTRDILPGEVKLYHGEIVMFDCAGLVTQIETVLDELAQRAAIEAIAKSDLVIFCADISKDDWSEDAAVWELIKPKMTNAIMAATKCDLPDPTKRAAKVKRLQNLFGSDFLVISSKTGEGLDELRRRIDKKLLVGSAAGKLPQERQGIIALTARHRHAATEAMENIGSAITELKAGSDEIAAMMLRSAYQALRDIENESIDEKVLETIFSRFCVGK